MKVLLIKDVKNLGKAGEVKEVKDGYGKNFLIARGFAKLATPDVIEAWKKEQAKKAQEEAAEIEKLKQLKEKIESTKLVIKHKAGANGALFGAITNKEVAEELKKQGIEIDKKHIDIHPPIKQAGEYEIDVKLGHGIHAKLNLVVEAE
ncbi:50S ribosomal protein L9 [Nitratiruptor sp. SB155-2]|uniref:Large ribosomal subunit protein bL9 n=1 Tax=Nitratiruptor sp. (strain SB155-2) TaxID=387092 RepID=RL9_NITSB|nr:50S ribosomal protein L9 [Nitratiruptor sp. SB155-2]A6Q3Q0.1 RecName: Full=Large ribosomal subunit protein bL9; AltName: Full=50S ribosomal protein L9 [Nitratiruptor sp. SB155-2]BAF70109.1 50S ribosomal protein L9 [Nitratiruptor sp. SB155-2]